MGKLSTRFCDAKSFGMCMHASLSFPHAVYIIEKVDHGARKLRGHDACEFRKREFTSVGKKKKKRIYVAVVQF